MTKARTAIATASLLMAAAVAHADSATATFLQGFPFPAAAPGAIASFSLNDDGTIAASVTSLYGAIGAFKFNSPTPQISSQFSVPGLINDPVLNGGFTAGFGWFNSGWQYQTSSTPGVTSVSWTIGQAGSFSSVADAFVRNYNSGQSGWALWVILEEGSVNAGQVSEWAANIEMAPAVPEASTTAMLLAGLAVLRMVTTRRRNSRQSTG